MNLEGENLTDTWIRTEELAVEYLRRANTWLREFYSETAKTFYIQFTDEDVVKEPTGLHTATYHIASNILDHEPHFLSVSELREWNAVRNLITGLIASLDSRQIENHLPTKSFGLLPLFSTTYRAELISYLNQPLRLEEYAIVIRRILYELFRQQSAQWSYPQKIERLHSFLLFRCANSLLRLRKLLNDSSQQDRQTFTDNLTNENIFRALVESIGNGVTYDEAHLERIYGVSGGGNFVADVLKHVTTTTGNPGKALIHTLEWIEDLSVNSAFAEIAKSRESRQRSDASALAFALMNLSVLNPERHDALLSQGIRCLVERCEEGAFPATIPFYIDEKGRALFVPSIEISNALLTLTFSRFDRVTDKDLELILLKSGETQNILIETYSRVDVHFDGGRSEKRHGWCSDRAPSPNRIDSWITGDVCLFLAKHIETLRSAKRRHILKSYSWISHSKLKTKWEDIVDPDDPAGLNGPKGIIERIVESTETRTKAPVFLLYGPPGTSKTTLVESLAQKMKWDLVKLSPADFVVESLDRIEYRAQKIFKDLMNLDNCVILMDELDVLLKDRIVLEQLSPGSIMEFVAPALLPKIQELRQYTLERNMAVFFVTNFYERIDRGLSRSGRIDNHLMFLPYNSRAQMLVAETILEQQIVGDRTATLWAVGKVLTELPCVFGYRGIEQIIEAVKAGQSTETIKNSARGYGIPLITYSARRRRDAFREFVAFVHRMQDRVFDPREISSLSAVAAQTELRSVSDAVRGNQPELAQFLDDWVSELDKPEMH